ncbi:MAG TPA: fumarylacetoacetate hydrolase family protein [Gemmatimonadaceae bacterium]|jgi:2-keto-4-pentenoate hydratase/2-oxohepta-3-ene-1,7-dioic acid hydratase in catechol pathway|nr:fumarylacetoacetate hydrolase family protein [Gemmatimonadaceae bacterium]
MRIISFATEESKWESPRVGIILHANGVDTRQRLDCEKLFAPEDRPSNPLAWFDMDGPWFRIARDTAARLERGDPTALSDAREKGWLVPAEAAYWFAPVPRPGKIVCIGMNYHDHAGEIGLNVPKTPAIFSKFSSCVVAPGEPVVIPPSSEQVDYEAELAVVIGRRATRVSADRAYDHVLGYTAFNDVTARDFQFGDVQWQRGKSCDTFAPMGQTIVTTDEIPDPHTLGIKLTVNGQVMQDSNTSQLIFRVPQLIEFITRSITLEPGDVIATGTPAGVGHGRKPPVYLKPGDVMQVKIDRIGELGNPVVAG